MYRRIIPFLLLLFLLAVTAIGYFSAVARRDVGVLAERSFPAVRILGDLRELVARVHISILTTQGVPSAPDAAALRLREAQLDRARELLAEYRATVVNSRDQELAEKVGEALEAYRARVGELAGAGATADLRESSRAYDRLSGTLTTLREHRLERVEDRISNVDLANRRGLRTNLVTLGLLLLAIVVTSFGIKRTAHDLHDH